FRYKVIDTTSEHKYSLRDLKTAQDWVLERQFRQVPGVIDVTSYGGETKEYHVEVDPYRLRGQGLTLQQIIAAIANSNSNVGGQRLSLGEPSYPVRAVGIIHSLRDIGNIVIAEQKDKSGAEVPIRVRDVAISVLGAKPRL